MLSSLKSLLQPPTVSAFPCAGLVAGLVANLMRTGCSLVICGLLFAAALSPAAQALEFSDIAHEGQLKFLAIHPDPTAYRYESRVKITEESLMTGVVSLTTCHYQLDPIRKVVIAFNPKRLQQIEIASASGMGGLEVKGHQIEMLDVKRGASICIDLQSRALDQIDADTFRLHAGPLMRRYFDGYLPMQATLKFEWPKNRMMLKAVNPFPQPGVLLKQDSDHAELDITFAGRLLANIDLVMK
jgi:hypothetical protein